MQAARKLRRADVFSLTIMQLTRQSLDELCYEEAARLR